MRLATFGLDRMRVQHIYYPTFLVNDKGARDVIARQWRSLALGCNLKRRLLYHKLQLHGLVFMVHSQDVGTPRKRASFKNQNSTYCWNVAQKTTLISDKTNNFCYFLDIIKTKSKWIKTQLKK